MGTPAELLEELDALIADVRRGGSKRSDAWRAIVDDGAFKGCAQNLAHYLALRRHDIRGLQHGLAALGLSSLGRLEGHVLPGLMATRASLAAVAGSDVGERPTVEEFAAGGQCLGSRREAMFGTPFESRPAALLITCPTDAADRPAFMRDLVDRGVEAVRINCAHDGPKRWKRMIDHARESETASGRRLRIFMDLAGPKIRTGKIGGGSDRLRISERFVIVPAGGISAVPNGCDLLRVECSLEKALRTTEAGHSVHYDDGKISGVIERVEPWGVVAVVKRTSAKGKRIKPEKGLVFPDADLGIAALTDKDRRDLRFIAEHADAVEYSFVQSAEDVRHLQDALADCRDDWCSLTLVLKIETRRAITNLPDIIVQAASRQPTAIMIARGDLAPEIGFTRTAEMQEEILWLAEAAHLPVIWATQVLEHFVKKGTPSRGEMTDAAMAARAECVMLNKGPFLLDAIEELHVLFRRMGEHQHKKSAELRRLRSW